MFVRPIGIISLLALLVSLPSMQRLPVPPTQPETGLGGKQQAHTAVIKNRYGKGAREYWIYEPDKPRPTTAPVVIFLHGWGGMNPLYYGAWIDHIVRRGNIVIYPRYQASILTRREDFIPNTIGALKDAFTLLQTDRGHVKADLTKVAAVGHSLGGVLAASVGALAAESGLPKVRAIMSVEPGLTRSPVDIPMADLKKIPSDTLLLSVAGDRDTLVDDQDAKRIFYESTQIPLENKDFIKLTTDDHGRPELIASHRAPTAPLKDYDNGDGDLSERLRGSGGGSSQPGGPMRSDTLRTPAVDALDYYGIWKLWDGLCDAAFFKKNRDFALGNTPQQRYMGKWSDGVPVKELVVTDKP
jgi:dienelactone hydrolase